jgi:curved DNA-binding protein
MDYYQILGVDKNSSPEELKQAYRKLAMKHHPDRGGDENEFKKISEAYDVLSNPEKKASYDNPRQAYSDWRGPFDPGEPFDFEDILRQARSAFHENRRQARNPDAITDVNVSLSQIFTGTDMLIDVGYTREVIYINPGVKNGTRLRLKGKGPSRYKDMAPGDLIVRVNIELPDNTAIDGNHFFVKIDVDALKAIVGTTIDYRHPTGSDLKITVPPGTQNNTKLRLRGLGVPDSNTRQTGDMFVIVNVFIPNVTDPEHIEQLNNIIKGRLI